MSLTRSGSNSPVLDPGADRFDWTVPFKAITSSTDIEEPEPIKKSASSDALSRLSPLDEGDLFDQQESSSQRTSAPKRAIDDFLPVVRRKKKPKSLPKRPLSAYNLYFQKLRAELVESSDQKLGFDELGKIVGKRWRTLPEEEREVLQELAVQDSERYRREMEEHKKRERLRKEERDVVATNPSPRGYPPDRTAIDNRAAPTSYAPPYGSVPPQQGYGPPPSYPPQGPGYQGSYQPFPPPPPYAQRPWGSHHSPGFGQSPYHGSYGESARPMPVMMEGEPKNGRPLPPGSEVHLRDADGVLRTYSVQYSMVTMSRHEAKEYMDRISKP